MVTRAGTSTSGLEPEDGADLVSAAAEFVKALLSITRSGSAGTRGEELFGDLARFADALLPEPTRGRGNAVENWQADTDTDIDTDTDVDTDTDIGSGDPHHALLSRFYDEDDPAEGERNSSAPVRSVVDQPPAAAPPASPGEPTAPADKAVILDPAQVTGPTAGTGPNAIIVKNSFDHPITLGQFVNGGSTTVPVASITLQPGRTGMLSHVNGEGGFIAKADASGQFQPSASRLEYNTDADGKMSWPDVSDITGRNAAIWFTDGKGLTKGDLQSIVGGAPADTVTTDAAGGKTIAGDYDESTATMRDGAAYMTGKLGTGRAYQHPNDDTRGPGQNPMAGTDSKVISAIFAPP